MVWIHGGGYAIGSGSWPLYDGEALARRGDVVVVTLNHRLGPLGYLHLADIAGEEFASSGNNGQLDLVAALEWVRDNIHAFGGDTSNVTVFGESGGGAKISTLLAMPSARGLFHRASIQSGPGLRANKADNATIAANKLLDAIGVTKDNVADLWRLDARAFVEASGAGFGPMGLGPVVDGSTLPANPYRALEDGTAADVSVIVGCNRDEGVGALPRELDDAGLRDRLAAFGPEHVDTILATYTSLHPEATNVDILSFAITDSFMRAGSIRLAEQKLKGSATPVFHYFFTYPIAGRAGHGYEIQFVFDNVAKVSEHASDRRKKVAAEMSEAWLAFARSGAPGWPAYTVPRRATMVWGRDGHEVVDDPSGPARELWDALPPPPPGMAFRRPPARSSEAAPA
jgi:para-nitrobenzyl esterase